MFKECQGTSRILFKYSEFSVHARLETCWPKVLRLPHLNVKIITCSYSWNFTKNVRQTIMHLCAFFSSICSKVIDPLKLDELQAEIVIILCQLEIFFPPSFFDIMVHLLVHLVREIKFCELVYLRWMYPI